MPYFADVYHGQPGPGNQLPVGPTTPAGWGGNAGLRPIGPQFGTRSNPSAFISVNHPSVNYGVRGSRPDNDVGVGGPLNSMLSQYDSPVATTPSTPGRPGLDAGPASFFAAAGGGEVGFGGPGNISAGAFSKGSSPFSQGVPNLSSEQIAQIKKLLGGSVYSAPLGGYITAAEANDPNSAYVKGYYGQPMTGGDPAANAAARRAYSIVGSAPTRPIGTSALNSLTGYSPAAGPSYNETLGQSYFGPFSFPGYPHG